MSTFKHAGDLGDIILFLPVIRAFGGGVLYIEPAKYTRQRLTPDKWCGIDLLLKQQPYIADVLPWNGERVSCNGNDFRDRMVRMLRVGQGKGKALVDWMLESHGLPLSAKNEPWLSVQPNRVARVVFNRAGAGRPQHAVYQNPDFPWFKVWLKYGKDAVFVGLPEEYENFCATCGEVPFHKTANLLEVAQVIAGADMFVGNQSVCHAIAEGLKKRIILEVWLGGPNCCHVRPGVVHGWNRNVELPEL